MSEEQERQESLDLTRGLVNAGVAAAGLWGIVTIIASVLLGVHG